ncbi:MAG: class I SAM-dependent methyltransferase [Fervidicoccaceae archaeon]|uniref:O-methyltransferase n=1 Tax=Desulfurococcus sp. TaxID=51678 RepID=UPI00316523F7
MCYSNGLLKYLNYLEKASDRMFIPRIDREDGLALYTLVSMLVENKRSFTAVDAGAGVGYSTLWIVASLDALCVKGVVYAVERNRGRYEVLKRNFENVKSKCVEVKLVNQDALDFIKAFGDGEIDFVFVDIDKHAYRQFFNEAVKKVRPRGAIAFHNAYVDEVAKSFKDVMSGESGFVATIIPTQEGILLVRIP